MRVYLFSKTKSNGLNTINYANVRYYVLTQLKIKSVSLFRIVNFNESVTYTQKKRTYSNTYENMNEHNIMYYVYTKTKRITEKNRKKGFISFFLKNNLKNEINTKLAHNTHITHTQFSIEFSYIFILFLFCWWLLSQNRNEPLK